MRVDYRKAALYGDCIIPTVYQQDHKTIVELANTEEEIFVVVEFEKKNSSL